MTPGELQCRRIEEFHFNGGQRASWRDMYMLGAYKKYEELDLRITHTETKGTDEGRWDGIILRSDDSGDRQRMSPPEKRSDKNLSRFQKETSPQ
ncbi:hypothetical protein Trydic_g1469 [Trypoxylus dichotomus]